MIDRSANTSSRGDGSFGNKDSSVVVVSSSNQFCLETRTDRIFDFSLCVLCHPPPCFGPDKILSMSFSFSSFLGGIRMVRSPSALGRWRRGDGPSRPCLCTFCFLFLVGLFELLDLFVFFF